MASPILSLQGATVVAGIESALIFKTLPNYLDDTSIQGLIKLIAFILALNYGLLFFYLTVIYPDLISPLRNFPRPKVRLFSFIHKI